MLSVIDLLDYCILGCFAVCVRVRVCVCVCMFVCVYACVSRVKWVMAFAHAVKDSVSPEWLCDVFVPCVRVWQA